MKPLDIVRSLPQTGQVVFHRGNWNNEIQRYLHVDLLGWLSPLSENYPAFERWYCSKVVSGVKNDTRKIIVSYRIGSIGGVSIVKDKAGEKKICTIRVAPEFQNRGLGVRLFEDSLTLLDCANPLLSVSEEKLTAFGKIFDFFRFQFTREYEGLYLPQKVEVSFNGLLR